jgi:hypothetical protein
VLKRSAGLLKSFAIAASLLASLTVSSQAAAIQRAERIVGGFNAVPAVSEGARSGPQGRIVGGAVIPSSSAPYQVYLEGPIPGGRYSCGGSLLSSTTVITAAHCVPGGIVDGKPHPASGMTILAGASNT